jgi:hypothetical protein
MADTRSTAAPAATDALAGKSTTELMGDLFERTEPGLFGEDDTPDEVEEQDDVDPETDTAADDGTSEEDTPDTTEEMESGAEDTEDDETTDAGAPETALIPVKIDGKVEKVTLDELKKGYSRTKVFTQKTQEVAEKRKAVEALEAQIQAEREQLRAALEQVTTAETDPEPNWEELAATDREEYLFQRQVWQDKQAKRDKLNAVAQELARRNKADAERQMAERITAEKEKLVEKIPAWKDPEVAKKELATIKSYLLERGFTEEETAQVYDHRLVLVLKDAARYKVLLAKGKDALAPAPKKTPATGPKTLTPGGGKPVPKVHVERKVALDRVKKTGSTTDAATAMGTIPGLFD